MSKLVVCYFIALPTHRLIAEREWIEFDVVRGCKAAQSDRQTRWPRLAGSRSSSSTGYY